MVNGETGFIRLNSGIGLHYSNILETEDYEIESVSKPGLTISLLLEGQVKFYLDGCPYYLGRSGRSDKHSVACGKIWSQVDPVKFCRVFRRGQKVKKIIISVDPEWLKNFGIGQIYPETSADLDRKMNEFILRVNDHREWPLSPRAISVAEEIINPPYESASMKQMVRECRAMELLLLALSSFASTIDDYDAVPKENANCKLIRIHTLIEENFHQNLSLDEIAKNAGLSVSSLQRHFKEAYGTTVVEYIRNRKLSFAKKLIEENNMPVTEVALRVGYTTPSSFTTAFKRFYGYTPTSFQH